MKWSQAVARQLGATYATSLQGWNELAVGVGALANNANDNFERSSGALADLGRLEGAGLTDSAIDATRQLTSVVTGELAVRQELSDGQRIQLLRRVLEQVTTTHRAQALESRDDYTLRESGKQTGAAAGELLGLSDESDFALIRDLRCQQLGETWEALGGKDGHRGVVASRRLRAAMWTGSSSVKTVERRQTELLKALLAAIKAYASQPETRDALLPPASSELSETTGERASEPQTPSSSPDRHRWAMKQWLLVVAGVIAGGAIAAILVTLSQDDPTNSPVSNQTLTGAASSQSPTLDPVPPCSSLPPDSQLAKQLRTRRQVIVDGRCYPDPTVDLGTQADPSRDTADVGLASTGTILEDVCLKHGQLTSDQVGTKTEDWVRFKARRSTSGIYISAVWVPGERGASPC